MTAVEKNVQEEGIGADVDSSGDYHVLMDDIYGEEPFQSVGGAEPDENSTSTNHKEPPTRNPLLKKKGSCKRKQTDEGDGLLKLLEKLHNETNSRLDTLSTRIGYDIDLGKARQEIFRHMDMMSELSDAQRYDLCDIIGKENFRLEIFMGLPDVKKPGYVLRVMEKERLI